FHALFKIDGYDCRKEDFIGIYNDYMNPQAVIRGRCSNNDGYAETLAAVFCKNIKLSPGQKITLHLIAGVSESVKKRNKCIKAYSKPNKIQTAFKKVNEDWENKINNVFIQTPDNAINLYTNFWLKNAIMQNCRWVRGPTSNSNFGFRDVLQDAKGIVKFDAERTRKALLTALRYQYADGTALRQWAIKPEFHDFRRFADSPLWIAFTLCAYIRETGDTDILNMSVPYFDKGKDTVYNHLLAGLFHVSSDLGSHNLPRVHEGDWQDGLGKLGILGRGESVWLAMAAIAANKETISLADFINDKKTSGKLKNHNGNLIAAVNKYGWDGKWYRRGFTDNGKPLGTSKDKEARIWLLPQAWALLSGVADSNKTRLLKQSVEKKLKTPVGYLLFDPPFKSIRHDVGYISSFHPKKWNYMHSNAFKFAAECRTGDPDSAYRTLNLMLPVNHDLNKIRSEPYAFSNYYGIHDKERMGRSMFGWFTATNAWVFTTIIEDLIGIKPGYNDIIIKPCLPSSWDKVKVEITIRNTRYNISVCKLNKKRTKTVKILADGKDMSSNTVPYFTDKKVHSIEVRIG
ncbi:MAG: hypothetical protein ABIA63_15025, partial [bacterium]